MSIYYAFNKRAWNLFLVSSIEPNQCQKCLSYSTLVFDQRFLGFKRNKPNCNFHYLALPIIVTVIEICGFHKNIKIQVSQEENNFPLNKKIHLSKAHNFITARSLNQFHYTQQKYQKSVLANSNLDTKILTEGNVNVTKIFLFLNNQ